VTEKTNPALRDTWQKWVKNEVILTLGWHIVSVCFCHTHVFIVNLLLFLRSSQGVQLLKHKNQYSDTMNTAIADATQSDAPTSIHFYSIIWKLGFNLLALDGW
jgi:Na+/H+-dicarboxylate symporter